jgi:hypothetical protein
MRYGKVAVGLFAVVTLVAAGCGGGGGDSGAKTDVGLEEYTVTPDPVELPAGEVAVTADNLGTVEHELVIVEADSAAALPTKADGSVDEDEIPERAKQGELEDVKKGTQRTKKFDLKAGTYVFFCNVVQDEGGTTISHFKQGMHEVVTVT